METSIEKENTQTAKDKVVDVYGLVIKPCPFCGKPPDMYFREIRPSAARYKRLEDDPGQWIIRCLSCSVQPELRGKKRDNGGGYNGQKETIDVWNKRAL